MGRPVDVSLNGSVTGSHRLWQSPEKTGNIWQNVYAQAVVTDEELEKTRQLPLPEIRNLASNQIERAKDFWKESSHLTWTEGLLISHLHWKPYKDVIENAENNFQLGENEQDPDRKKLLYLLAWRTARIAVDSIAKEVKQDRSYWEVLAEPITKPVKEAYREAKETLKDSSNTIAKVSVVLAVLFLFLESRK